jgi:hypothetical protein
VNPIHEGRNRTNLDALLSEVAARGVWVSAHPDAQLPGLVVNTEVYCRAGHRVFECERAPYKCRAKLGSGMWPPGNAEVFSLN